METQTVRPKCTRFQNKKQADRNPKHVPHLTVFVVVVVLRLSIYFKTNFIIINFGEERTGYFFLNVWCWQYQLSYT